MPAPPTSQQSQAPAGPPDDTADDPGGEPGEAWVIATVLEACAPATDLLIGPGDDAAVLRDGTALTVDTLVEGVHFDARLSPDDVGWKAVAVNASDLGAMGCRPEWALLSLSLADPVDPAWVRGFASGLSEALARWRIALVGGDTTRSPGPAIVSVTMGGRVTRPVTRAGARPGDLLWVTGAPGEAAHGFARGGPGLGWLRRPVPPVELGVALAEGGLVHAMMDLSDGIRRDLARLCAASGVGATVDPALLPRGPALRDEADPLPWQVAFGDDYELLFASPHAAEVRGLASALGVRATAIGTVDAAPGLRLRGRPWPRPTFAHFGGRP